MRTPGRPAAGRSSFAGFAGWTPSLHDCRPFLTDLEVAASDTVSDGSRPFERRQVVCVDVFPAISIKPPVGFERPGVTQFCPDTRTTGTTPRP